MDLHKRILLVEDDRHVREMITNFLSGFNCTIIEAHDVASAMQAVSDDARFDLAILDFWLGDDPAVSIMDFISSKIGQLPIIIVSGGNGQMDLEKTAAIADVSGAVVFLQKPFRKDDLMTAVKVALKNNT